MISFKEFITEGDVIKTKFATKNMQKRGIVGPTPLKKSDDALTRNWALKKHPEKVYKKIDDKTHVAVHGNDIRFMNPEKGTHFDIKGGGTKVVSNDLKKRLATSGPVSYAQKKVKPKTGNVVQLKK